MRPVILPSKVRPVPATTPYSPTSIPPRPRLSVVIVNYNTWDDVSALVLTLSATPEVRSRCVEVLVVDNASDGPIPDTLRPARAGVCILSRDDNGGFAAGVNAGMRESRSPWLLLLNPDVVVEADFLARILGRIDVLEGRGEGRPGIVGFALKNPDGSPQPSVGAEPGLLRSLMGQFIPRSRRKYQAGWRVKPGPVPWVTGACMLIDGELFNALGGMDEDFFLYYEEVALCLSVRNAGRAVEYDDHLSVVHLRPLQNRPLSARMCVIVRHSKILIFRKHLPRWQFLALTYLIGAEAAIRGRRAVRRKDGGTERAWRAIATIASRLRRGSLIRGREVLLLADQAISPPETLATPQPHGFGRRRRSSRSSANPH